MNCPVCGSLLAEKELEPFLTARQCSSCHGLWLSSTTYLVWVQRCPTDNTAMPPVIGAEKGDYSSKLGKDKQHRAKLCLDCGKIMYPIRIGFGLPFRIDCCSKCTSIWLSAEEWAALKQLNLHNRLHLICSDAWQTELKRRDSAAIREAILRDKLSPEDRDKVEQTKLWLQNHPPPQPHRLPPTGPGGKVGRPSFCNGSCKF